MRGRQSQSSLFADTQNFYQFQRSIAVDPLLE
jgi:hypothetical protein